MKNSGSDYRIGQLQMIKTASCVVLFFPSWRSKKNKCFKQPGRLDSIILLNATIEVLGFYNEIYFILIVYVG